MNPLQVMAAALMLTEPSAYVEESPISRPGPGPVVACGYDGNGPRGAWDKCVAHRKRHLDARKRQKQARKRQRRVRP
jgi:hypothetical protein